jgi:hypothetical protein
MSVAGSGLIVDETLSFIDERYVLRPTSPLNSGVGGKKLKIKLDSALVL